jgi:hypothetical protein
MVGFDAAHYRNTQEYVNAVNALFDRATHSIAAAAARGKYDPDKPFSLRDHPEMRETVQKVTAGLTVNMKSIVERGSRNQWLYACEKNDEFIGSIMNTSKVSKARLNKMQDRNLDALSTFQGRKVGGMDLSKRVWNYVDQYKDQIELGLDVGLGEGRSAAELSRDLRQNLKDPDRLFRRVRDKHGNLQLSKAAKAFNPGQGVYRSSYANAMRLTRSEINMSYREADWLRWQQLDFVVGFEVRVSNRHEEWLRNVWNKKNPGKIEICDQLKGRYPKTFKFKGWHPQCMCYCVPILMDEETFDKQELSDLKSALNGTEYKKYESKDAVTEMPAGFNNWVDENMERQKKWRSAPYFVRDNFKHGQMDKGLRIDLPAQQKPPVDPVEAEMNALQSRISEIKRRATEYGTGTMALDMAIAERNVERTKKHLSSLENDFNYLDKAFTKFTSDKEKVIQEAKLHNVPIDSRLTGVITKKDWYKDGYILETLVDNLKSEIAKAIENKKFEEKHGKGVSRMMPKEFAPGGDYLHGEEYTFDKDFFDLFDPNKPIALEIVKRDNQSAYYPGERKVRLSDAARAVRSNWERKAVVYHEYGHALDWQRNLRHSPELKDLREKHIKSLRKRFKYTVTEKRFNPDKLEFETINVVKNRSKVAFIDNKLEELSSRVWRMKDETFTKRGITRYDVLEQIMATRDTIKSLVISYGDGHSSAYFRGPGKKEAEYLAHAFENAFIGNRVFKKYMPEIYDEMIAYIRTLK